MPGGAVATQEGDPASLLRLYRDLIALRRTLGDGIELLDAPEGVLAYRRGAGHLVALNLTSEESPAPHASELLRHTHGRSGNVPDRLAGGEGFVARV